MFQVEARYYVALYEQVPLDGGDVSPGRTIHPVFGYPRKYSMSIVLLLGIVSILLGVDPLLKKNVSGCLDEGEAAVLWYDIYVLTLASLYAIAETAWGRRKKV